MDRVSGDYKRFSHYFALLFGLAVAVIFNVDSIRIANVLWHDPARREAVVEAAAKYQQPTNDAAADKAARDAAAKDAEAELAALPLPIGWPDTDATGKVTLSGDNRLQQAWDAVFKKDGSGVSKLLGWIMTAFAVSLGAPF